MLSNAETGFIRHPRTDTYSPQSIMDGIQRKNSAAWRFWDRSRGTGVLARIERLSSKGQSTYFHDQQMTREVVPDRSTTAK